jgi:hypothetical protein
MYLKHALAIFHKKLGHSNAESIKRFLSMAKPYSIVESENAFVKKVVEECTVYEKFGPRPRRERPLISANVVTKLLLMSTDFLHYQ